MLVLRLSSHPSKTAGGTIFIRLALGGIATVFTGVISSRFGPSVVGCFWRCPRLLRKRDLDRVARTAPQARGPGWPATGGAAGRRARCAGAALAASDAAFAVAVRLVVERQTIGASRPALRLGYRRIPRLAGLAPRA